MLSQLRTLSMGSRLRGNDVYKFAFARALRARDHFAATSSVVAGSFFPPCSAWPLV
jgi:hypothetical protein